MFCFVLSRVVSCQASPGVGGLPLLSEEGHGLVGGSQPLARHFLMQRHPLRGRRMEKREGSFVKPSSCLVFSYIMLQVHLYMLYCTALCVCVLAHHVVPGRNDELLLLVVSGSALLIVVLYKRTSTSITVRFYRAGVNTF